MDEMKFKAMVSPQWGQGQGGAHSRGKPGLADGCGGRGVGSPPHPLGTSCEAATKRSLTLVPRSHPPAHRPGHVLGTLHTNALHRMCLEVRLRRPMQDRHTLNWARPTAVPHTQSQTTSPIPPNTQTPPTTQACPRQGRGAAGGADGLAGLVPTLPSTSRDPVSLGRPGWSR